MEYVLERNADVVVTKGRNESGKVIAIATINDKWQHEFAASSRISKHLQLMDPEDLSKRLSGGSYFIVDGQLTDFRDGSYNGHIHTDEDIHQLMHHVGVTDYNDEASALARVCFGNQDKGNVRLEESRIILARTNQTFDLTIPELSADGTMSAGLAYSWSPFQRHLNSLFVFTRLACGNDLVSNSNLINARIPMVNCWDQHMDIASEQLKHKVQTIVPSRIAALQGYNASVATLNNVCKHISERRMHTDDGHIRRWLDSLYEVADPMQNLHQYYKTSAIEDACIASQLPSHLSGVDVFNIVTELRTHTQASAKSTNGALDRIGNDMVFSHAGVLTSFAGNGRIAKSSAFASADDAFYGIGIA